MKNHPGKMVVNDPINIVLSGPGYTPLALIDLPGIIHHGDGEQEVEDMIKTFIKPESTLILLVRLVNTDDENVKALKIIKEFDPFHRRTVQVYTKCDVFESDDRRSQLKGKILAGIGSKNGCHAVSCRVEGKKSDTNEEMKNFVEEGFSDLIEVGNIGVENLKNSRLPKLLRERIMENLPSLKLQISEKMRKAAECLNSIGWEKKSGSEIIRNLMRNLCSADAILRDKITPHLLDFQDKIGLASQNITEDQVKVYFKRDAFEPIYFQGVIGFKACVKDMGETFRPICDNFVDAVKEEIIRAFNYQVLEETFSCGILGSLRKNWEDHIRGCERVLRNNCSQIIYDNQRYNTMNHYLDDNYQKYFGPNEAVTEQAKIWCHKVATEKLYNDTAYDLVINDFLLFLDCLSHRSRFHKHLPCFSLSNKIVWQRYSRMAKNV
jgi:hypothetical protein